MPDVEIRVNATLRLCFDEESEVRLRKLFDEFKGLQLNLPKKLHLTLATGDNLPWWVMMEALEKVMFERAKFEVEFCSLGLFVGTEKRFVYHLQPAWNKDLLMVHEHVVDSIKDFPSVRLRPHHLPKRWVPHITLHNDLTPEKVVNAMIAAKECSPLRLGLRVDRLECVSDRREVTYRFNGNGSH